MLNHIGNPLQLRGAEQYVLQGGKGDGMHFLCVRNGLGLEAWISLDRCGDLSRVTFKGDNMGFFAPCGYVAPAYYDKDGTGFLKSFTAGFCTTCGLTAVGSPCTDEGEELPLHGTLSNTPAALLSARETEDGLVVELEIRDCSLFGRKLVMSRRYVFSYTENTVSLEDAVLNDGDETSPYMILYHCNMGYPLLSERSRVFIPHTTVIPRNSHAAEAVDTCLKMQQPTPCYEECCYYYDVKEQGGIARAGIYNEDIRKGVLLSYDKAALPRFTQWKMMGRKDYVLGLEPGNCTPDGRDVLRRKGELYFLQPGEIGKTALTFRFTESEQLFTEE